MMAADTRFTCRSQKMFSSNMAILKLTSTIKRRKKKSVYGKNNRRSCLRRNHKVVASTIRRAKAKDHIRGMMKGEKSKEKDISRERIDEINRTIRTTRIIKKKIKSCLNN
jgi:hypothetical protein